METKALELEGLPEPIARALEAVAEIARKIAGQQGGPAEKAPELPELHLGAVGSLTREEICGDYTCRS
jgi:broad specificity phosphatase PhoE